MFDIGIGEFLVIGVLALLVFGPDRLPRAAADAGRFLRQLRQTAATARSELAQAAGIDEGGDLSGVMSELRELDPRRVVGDVLRPVATDLDPGSPQAAAHPPANPRTAGAGTDAQPATKPPPADPDWS